MPLRQVDGNRTQKRELHNKLAEFLNDLDETYFTWLIWIRIILKR